MLDDSSPIQEPHLRDIKDDAFSNGSTAVPSDTGTPVSEPLEKSFRYSDYTKDSDATYTSEQERKILSRQLKGEAVKVKLKTLYRYATPRERLILLVSTICALAAGTAQPLMTLILGSLSGSFEDYSRGEIAQSDFASQLSYNTTYYVYLAIGTFITVYIATVGFNYAGEKAACQIRERYLAAILSQNIAYFENIGTGDITTSITSDTIVIQEGISEKLSLALTAISTTITAFVIAFARYWKLTLILMSTVMAMFIVIFICSRLIAKYKKFNSEANNEGATFTEEVFSSIRNAVAFNAQEKLAKKYESFLSKSEEWAFKHQGLFGTMFAAITGIVILEHGLAFWMGARFLIDGDMDLSEILTIVLCVMIGALSLGNIAPNARAYGAAIMAGTRIFSVIDRASPMDSSSKAGNTLANINGFLEVKNLKHIYPSRPDATILKDVSLTFPAGKVTALVGGSGSGKSTIVGILERFYEPVAGEVLLDGHDIRTLNLKWLRQQISWVGQEPTLFNSSVFENIAFGLIGSEHENSSVEKKTELVIDAARTANANEFIIDLPDGYDTLIGAGGVQLSGGQKQRIAIARAVVSNPKILLLDEATSALDTKSEEIVQKAIDKAAHGRTTIVIAHRLSTVKTADNIVVMEKGSVIEQGSHDELVTNKGAYYKLAETQHLPDKLEHHRRPQYEIEIQKALDPEEFDLDIGRFSRVLGRSSIEESLLPSHTPLKYPLGTIVKLVAGFNRKEVPIMLIGIFFAIIAGGGIPTQSVFFAEAIVSLALPPSEYSELQSDASFWSSMYLMLGIVIFIANAIQGWCMAYCTERLVYRVRDQVFRSLLRQDISYFDQHSSGSLTAFLSTETIRLAGMGGVTLASVFGVVTTLTAVTAVSLAIGWKLALVCISTMPVLLGTGYLKFSILARMQAKRTQLFSHSAQQACEAVSAIRTVAALTLETEMCERYKRSISSESQTSLKGVLISAAFFAASQSLRFLCIALAFWYGGTLIEWHEYSLFQFYVCFAAIIFGVQSAGAIFSSAPDISKARQAGQAIKTLFDRKVEVDAWSNEGKILPVGDVEGSIEFQDVHFQYPTRPGNPILRGVTITAKPGQYVALVGLSGCGKSTAITLLERFYTPSSGRVLLDGKDVAELHVKSYRSHMALVGQEPTLYQGSVQENILLGIEAGAEVSQEAIIKACKDANIYDFILSLPDGFSTPVGSKGCLLSGGQKQRLAIARALLTNPKILLLDEATSALDSTSESVVQTALDRAAKGRTTIAVAHRLSTIQNADVIYVIHEGRIVESGTHWELMNREGKYFEMVKRQSLGEDQ